jgi:hypothetical protein
VLQQQVGSIISNYEVTMDQLWKSMKASLMFDPSVMSAFAPSDGTADQESVDEESADRKPADGRPENSAAGDTEPMEGDDGEEGVDGVAHP